MGNGIANAIPSPLVRWTDAVEESWHVLFRFIIYFMKVGYRDTKREAERAEAAAASSSKGKNKKNRRASEDKAGLK